MRVAQPLRWRSESRDSVWPHCSTEKDGAAQFTLVLHKVAIGAYRHELGRAPDSAMSRRAPGLRVRDKPRVIGRHHFHGMPDYLPAPAAPFPPWLECRFRTVGAQLTNRPIRCSAILGRTCEAWPHHIGQHDRCSQNFRPLESLGSNQSVERGID